MLCHFPSRPNQLAACDDLTEKSIYFTLICGHAVSLNLKRWCQSVGVNVLDFPNKHLNSQIQPACMSMHDHIKKHQIVWQKIFFYGV